MAMGHPDPVGDPLVDSWRADIPWSALSVSPNFTRPLQILQEYANLQKQQQQQALNLLRYDLSREPQPKCRLIECKEIRHPESEEGYCAEHKANLESWRKP